MIAKVLCDIQTYCGGPFCKRVQRHAVRGHDNTLSLECSRCFVSRAPSPSEVDLTKVRLAATYSA